MHKSQKHQEQLTAKSASLKNVLRGLLILVTSTPKVILTVSTYHYFPKGATEKKRLVQGKWLLQITVILLYKVLLGILIQCQPPYDLG